MIEEKHIPKIAFVGNMNNMLFPLARYLADENFSVTLFLLDEYAHFLPQADISLAETRVEIIDLDYNKSAFLYQSSSEIKKIFLSFDFIIGTDYAPALLIKGGVKLDVFFPIGHDLMNYPFYKIERTLSLPTMYEIMKWRRAKFQTWALPLLSAISMDPANEFMEKCIRTLKLEHIPRIPAVPFLYLPQYTEEAISKSKYINLIDELRKKNDFLVMQHCRQSWSDKKSVHYKANEYLINGFAHFVKSHLNKKIKLILIEYGSDVKASKQLCLQLGIGDKVAWLPKMAKKDLLPILKKCDVSVGELGASWFSYGAVYEALAMKTFFIGRRNDADYKDQLTELYPMLSVTNESEVLNALEKVYTERAFYKQKTEEAYLWFCKYAIDASKNKILEMIQNKTRTNEKISNFLKMKIGLVNLCVSVLFFLNKIKIQFGKTFSKAPERIVNLTN